MLGFKPLSSIFMMVMITLQMLTLANERDFDDG